MNQNNKTDTLVYLNLEQLGDYFFDWIIDIEQKDDWICSYGLQFRLITELCERNIIERYSWNFKDGLQFVVKKSKLKALEV